MSDGIEIEYRLTDDAFAAAEEEAEPLIEALRVRGLCDEAIASALNAVALAFSVEALDSDEAVAAAIRAGSDYVFGSDEAEIERAVAVGEPGQVFFGG